MSLIELMIVIAIAAALTMMAAPNYIQWTARNALKRATLELHSSINLTRMVAMNRNTTAVVTLSGGGTSPVQATFVDGFGGTIIPVDIMPPQVVAWGGTSPIQFNSLGLRVGGPVGANQTIALTNNQGVTFTIEVTPAGKTRWCASAACP